MLPLNELVEGIDLSNWQGELSDSQCRSIRSAGKRFAIVRLSQESAEKRAIAARQIAALEAADVTCIGYGWAYWRDEPLVAARQWAMDGSMLSLPIICIDAEDDVPAGVDAAQWLATAATELGLRGIIPIAYSDPGWWQRFNVDLRPLGDIRWWVADWDGNHELNAPAPYLGARIVGHQYANAADGQPFAYDSDVMMFDAEMLGQLPDAPPALPTEERVRELIREELAAIVSGQGQGDDLGEWIHSVTARLAAAGQVFDLNSPVPMHLASRAIMGTELAGPPEAYPAE